MVDKRSIHKNGWPEEKTTIKVAAQARWDECRPEAIGILDLLVLLIKQKNVQKKQI